MKMLFMILILILSGCSSSIDIKSVENEKDDYYSIFSSLLGINEDRFTYVDNDGKLHSDQLKIFKELEGVYIPKAFKI